MIDRSRTARRIGSVVLVLLLAGVVIGGFLIGAFRLEVPTRIVGAPVCEGLDTHGRQFTADIRGVRFAGITESNEGRGVVYRRAANTDSDSDVAGRLLPGNCQVGFEGFCIGEALPDFTDLSESAPQDQQWFILPDDRGYMHGGVVQELPPGTIGEEPQECNGGREEPTQIAVMGGLATTLNSDMLIQVSADNAATVAGAAYSLGLDGKSAWRKVGMDVDASDGFDLALDLAASVPQSGATLLLTVCWAGNVPGRAETHMSVDIGAPSDQRPETTTPDIQQGASVACKHVGGGV